MKQNLIIITLCFCLTSCNYNKNSKLASQESVEFQRIEALEKEKMLIENDNKFNKNLNTRPELKGYRLDTRNYKIFETGVYTEYSTTVAGLEGKIEILFDKDRSVKTIKFTHKIPKSEKKLELTEFASLIADKYNLNWDPIEDKENPSHAEFKYLRDSTIFFLSGEVKYEPIGESSNEQLLRKLKREENSIRKDGKINANEMFRYEEIQKQIYYLTHRLMLTYIFQITNKNFLDRLRIDRMDTKLNEEKEKNNTENQKRMDLLKDF